MKKSILTVFLMFAVCAGFAFSQTKKIVRKSAKGTITKRTVIKKTKRKTIRKRKIRKMEITNSSAVTTESGLTYIITKNGDGAQIKAGDNVIVNYTGMLTNGAKFDSSLDRNEPFSFPVGAGMVIKGWDEGLQKLRIGDHAILTIPPSIGYGASGAGGVIPPNATLIFIIEVIGVK
jgi:FKBP-type peptidyl-prolyl cis-trans isomerase